MIDPELTEILNVVKNVSDIEKTAYEEHSRIRQEAENAISSSWKIYREKQGSINRMMDSLRDRFVPFLRQLFEEEGYPQEHLADGWVSSTVKGLTVIRTYNDWEYKYEFSWEELYQAEKESKELNNEP